MNGHAGARTRRAYAAAVRRAFREVAFYRSQCAAAGRLLDEPVPVPTAAVPDPPYELCPFPKPWRPDRELPLWTPDPRQLAGALRIAGLLPATGTVLEVRPALVDRDRLTRRVRYGVLLGAEALVASEDHRRRFNNAVLAAARRPVLVIGAFESEHPVVGRGRPDSVAGGATLLHDPTLGYLGARHRECGRMHLDTDLVHAAARAGEIAFSLVRRTRPTLLAIVPPGTSRLRLADCARHGTPVLEVRPGG
jgi:hypothetical protein